MIFVFIFVTGIVCVNPGIPVRGLVTPLYNKDYRYPIETTVKYECQTDFILHGASVLTCNDNGEWDFPLPQCKG